MRVTPVTVNVSVGRTLQPFRCFVFFVLRVYEPRAPFHTTPADMIITVYTPLRGCNQSIIDRLLLMKDTTPSQDHCREGPS
jgi:hypothetical protein